MAIESKKSTRHKLGKILVLCVFYDDLEVSSNWGYASCLSGFTCLSAFIAQAAHPMSPRDLERGQMELCWLHLVAALDARKTFS